MLTVLALDGSSYGYLWVLRQANLSAEKTASGEPETVWMTTAVSSPRIGGAGLLTFLYRLFKSLINLEKCSP